MKKSPAQLSASFATAIFFLFNSGPSDAGQPDLEMTGSEAIGRLSIDGRSMCTGSLIAPDIVLTAAHCLHLPGSGQETFPQSILFEAGLQGRSSRASRRVTRAALHPGYDYQQGAARLMGHDLAVLLLETPITPAQASPLSLSMEGPEGRQAAIFSYARRYGPWPFLEEGCQILFKRKDTLIMSCEVDFGASGAPVLKLSPNAPPAILSVISAKAMMGSKRISIASTLDETLHEMIETIRQDTPELLERRDVSNQSRHTRSPTYFPLPPH